MQAKVKIRHAKISDSSAIARVHVDSWRTTYKDIVPAEFLRAMSYERRTTMWASLLRDQERGCSTLLAEIESLGVVGFVDFGRAQETYLDYSAEILAIYLLAEFQGQGIGRELFDRAVLSLRKAGHASMFLWGLAENPARGFYERMGGQVIGEKEIEIGGARLNEIGYGWKFTKLALSS